MAEKQAEKEKEKEKVKKERKKKLDIVKKGWHEKAKCPHCPGYFANEVMKFVGFKGYKDKQGICHFNKEGIDYPGEAFPPPVDKNREFVGILEYELEIMTLMFLFSNIYGDKAAIAVLMPRGHGKTYINAWMDQIKMKWFLHNIMMLSETSARLKVGNWIYQWALRNGYLKDPEAYARKNTYQHFELINETRMDIYKFMKEDLVGEHNYTLSLDDIVKRNWKFQPTDNERAVEHWQSNINYIIRNGLFIFGTRKFEGDPLEHILKTIEGIIVIKKSPFIECEHGNRNDDGTYDACEICRDACLLAPELHSYDDLMLKMREDYESWYAEMMQNPHPMEGGMVDKDDLKWVNRPHHSEVQLVGIGVDSTESELDSVDMVGIVSCTMGWNEFEKNLFEPEFTFLDACVKKMPFRNYTDKDGVFHKGIMETITEMYEFLRANYPNVGIIIAIERKGGGVYIIREAINDYKTFPWMRHIIGEVGSDKKKTKHQQISTLGITHAKEKTARVYAELQHPIKKHQVRFCHSLFGTEFVKQVCTFPKGKYDDGVDAGGMIKDELFKKFVYPRRSDMKDPLMSRVREEQIRKQWNAQKAPWEAIKQKALRNDRIKNRHLKEQLRRGSY